MDQQPKIPSSLYAKDGHFFLIVNAKPNSKVTQLTAITEEALDINIAAPPRDGEANEELCTYVAQTLSLKKSAICVQKGGKGRNKLIQVDGKIKDLNTLYQMLQKECQ